MPLLIFAVIMFITANLWASGRLRTLYSFNGGTAGENPGAIISNGVDTIYGVSGGGTYKNGMVFSLSKAAGFRVIYNFHGAPNDGTGPQRLTLDQSGNLFGVTSGGGLYKKGTVFELSPTSDGQWVESVLYNCGASQGDGWNPDGGLVIDGSGNLYGATGLGGSSNAGSIFELSPVSAGWTYTVLYNFAGAPDGDGPGPLFLDNHGNLYGETSLGGKYTYGTVFELSPSGEGSWTENVLYSFGSYYGDGRGPDGGLSMDSFGNLYGTTIDGGLGCAPAGCGTVFQLSSNVQGWTETVLHRFGLETEDGSHPQAPVTLDQSGKIYGTTTEQGTFGHGTVFELVPQPNGTWAIGNYSFTGGSDGGQPEAGVLLDNLEVVYGTTVFGGLGYGVIFQGFPPRQ